MPMTLAESPEARFNKHPETSINSKNTSLDDEFISWIQNYPELDGLINTDIDKCMDPCSIYIKIISKLSLLESPDIKILLTGYVNSTFWDSLGSEKQSEFIETALAIQEEKEQDAIGTIWIDKNQSGSEKAAQGKPKKMDVPFDVVADRILQQFSIFTMRDSKQIYLYKNGVYKCEGSEAILDTEIWNRHNEIYREYWNDNNPDFPIAHIPKATVKFVNEVLAHIRAYTHIIRESI